MNSDQNSDYGYEDYDDYKNESYGYNDYILYSEPLLEINTSSLSTLEKQNALILKSNAALPSIPEIDIILSKNYHLCGSIFFYRKKPNNLVCFKCNIEFSDKTGNSTLKNHLKNQHNIIISRIKAQSKLAFVCNDPWSEKQKKI
ncbi:zinc finger bed domain-containing protein 1-like [Gigaspora margarita]|uniref:Zinc finger bed domain-containing protein 1-like n=1 Tax=Gigaspora margarita TaxID=4874 RepID=A0A8H4A9W1_GIGMA|nr:zinc finger bed domain-containing protein 1-like [Gigaspora margarita]